MDMSNDFLVKYEMPGSSSVSASHAEQDENANHKQMLMELQLSIQKNQAELAAMKHKFIKYRILRNEFNFELGKLAILNQKTRMIHQSSAKLEASRVLYEKELAKSIDQLNTQRALVSQWKSYFNISSCALENIPVELSTKLREYNKIIKNTELRVTDLKEELKKVNSQTSIIFLFFMRSDQRAQQLEENLKLLAGQLGY
ncbi:uncharacterized protein LOC26535739 [Drosophila yakuba]|uniref:DUF4201 domain-containing protein n=1 Tax=Drosophila yakuba TaxID=7245 RepID=A0A0R1E2D5_DROYA|nr:uncharacterized protein LOC26535739 [Drosophila yakuba]KRK01873.1 uncharacterized protein Dyak_GE28558 [Drosophila yakuba]